MINKRNIIFPAILLVLITITTSMSHAQNKKATIEGKVTEKNGKAIELANVALIGEAGGTTTNRKGSSSYLFLQIEILNLQLHMLGFLINK